MSTASFTTPAARVVQGQASAIPGELIVDHLQISWSPRDPAASQSFKVAIQAITGTLQKAKSKPQMRIPTLSGPLMLEFPSMEDRDAAISQITPLLARKQQSQPGSVIEPTGAHAAVKKELLQEDRDLKGLYDELVRGSIISDAEFWKGRQDIVLRKAGGASGKRQVVGLSSALLAQLQPSTDGKGKQMTMTITPQFIQQVFAEKPHVHRAFVENVPQKMDEKEFWTRFAKHEIQMQERRKSASKRVHEPPDPLFSRLTPQLREAADTSKVDPALNLATDKFDNPRSSSGVDDAIPPGDGESIARDMNLHSAVVLQGPVALDVQQRSEAGPSSSASRPHAPPPDTDIGAWRERRGSSGLDDLRAAKQATAEELHIRNARRYFERPVQQREESKSGPMTMDEIAASLSNPVSKMSLDPAVAEQVLLDLQRESAVGVPENWFSAADPESLMPQMKSMLRQTALVSNELLRQFWRCFPIQASVARERRATKLKDAMEKKYTQLEHMQSAAQPGDKQLIAQLLRPVKQALDAGLDAYQAEMQAG